MYHQITDLGELEHDVLDLVWRLGSVTADVIQKRLGRPLKESTVRTVLTRLEQKGHLSHTTEGRTFIYSATEGRAVAAGRAVKGIVDRFCNGSMEDVLVGMVNAKILNRRELRELAQKIAKAKGGSKP